MPQWERIQDSFSAGEVGLRLFMKESDPGFRSALLECENFYPGLQGSAIRTPGTRYVYTVPNSDTAVRIIPYNTPRNTQALVEITEGQMRVVDDIGLGINDDIVSGGTSWKNVTSNYQCRSTFFPWDMEPQGEVAAGGDNLGWTIIPGRFSGTARISQSEAVLTTCSMENECNPIPEDAPNGVLLQVDLQYANNFAVGNTPEDEKIARIEIRDAPNGGGTLFYEEDLDYLQVGQSFAAILNIGGSYLAGQVFYVRFWFQATRDDEKDTASTPNFLINQLGIRAPVAVAVVPDVVTGTIPWLESELDDIQFVQSPYPDSSQGNLYGKQVVFTHGNHPPQELIFTGSEYQLRPIFTDEVTQHYEQWQWDTQGYPAACSSYQGRLVLAGSNLEVADSPTGTNSENVWATESRRWFAFTDPESGEVPDAADSVDFTAIYRSPIQWVFGQKSLLIGAESMEYAATSDNVFAPNDLGIFMQSTHGSSRVQPAGFGSFALFAGEAGRKLRAMQYVDEDAGWVSPDLGLQHPTLFDSGIRRIIRMRNPQQMAVVVRGDGQLALLHYDTNANILGWSRIRLNDPVIDACILPDDTGADVLMLAVRRRINGVWKITIEGINRWYDGEEQTYLNSGVLGVNNPASPTISGLDHLEGAYVQVVGDGAFLGTYQVSGGSVTVDEKAPGVPRNITWFNAGLAMTARLRTMPLVTSDPSSKKRYPKISVACINSSRPIINGERPDDRSPISSMNISQPRDIIAYNEVANLGSDETQVITIEENLPVRTEVIGVFGKVAGNSV